MKNSAARRPIKLTYRDYAALSTEKRYELIDGELLMAPSPPEQHQRTSGNLYRLLSTYALRRRLGRVYEAPFDVVLSPHDTVQPDVLFISTSRMGILTAANVQGAPDWVAEVVSPDSVERDYQIKKRLYAKRGVREYWIADPLTRAVEVHVLHGGRYRLLRRTSDEGRAASALIRGFSVTLKRIFDS